MSYRGGCYRNICYAMLCDASLCLFSIAALSRLLYEVVAAHRSRQSPALRCDPARPENCHVRARLLQRETEE